MADQLNEQPGDTEEASGKVLIASATDLEAICVEKTLGNLDRADDVALEQALRSAAKAADEAGNAAAARGYRLLMFLCTLHLRVEDPAEPWGPRFQGPEGRSYTASDFRGGQNTILAGLIDKIGHPALRARVADVVWYNDRTQGAAAVAAIEAYCETIDRHLDGTYERRFKDVDSILDLVDWFDRAVQIARTSHKRGEVPDVVQQMFEALYERAHDAGQYVAFDRVARIGVSYDLIDWRKVAPDAEQVADQRDGGDYPMAVKSVWNLAAQGYAKMGDEDAKRRCQARSVDETLKMREQVGSASAQAFWTRKAIGELRAARGFKDRIAELRKELRDLQDASLDEFGEFTVPIDLTHGRQRTVEIFDALNLPDILIHFALIASSPRIEDLRQQALDSQKDSVLSSLFGASYSDHEGKTVAETPASTLGGEPDDAWFKGHYLRSLDIWRLHVVGGSIEPARHTIMSRFPLEIRHFNSIAEMSPFVPPGHEHIFALGFARLMQGDAASAAFLLIPQLENSLRHVMLNSSRETSKIKPDLLQEDRSLSGMLGSLRPELEEVFGPDVVNEIDLLFHHSAGPQLRHEMAHGKMSVGECYSPTGVYASWMIYRLTCLPLITYWKDRIAPAIEKAAL